MDDVSFYLVRTEPVRWCTVCASQHKDAPSKLLNEKKNGCWFTTFFVWKIMNFFPSRWWPWLTWPRAASAPARWPTRTTTTAPWRWRWGLTWLESIPCRLPCRQLRCLVLLAVVGKPFWLYSAEALRYFQWNLRSLRGLMAVADLLEDFFLRSQGRGSDFQHAHTGDWCLHLRLCSKKRWNQLFQELRFLDRLCRVW